MYAFLLYFCNFFFGWYALYWYVGAAGTTGGLQPWLSVGGERLGSSRARFISFVILTKKNQSVREKKTQLEGNFIVCSSVSTHRDFLLTQFFSKVQTWFGFRKVFSEQLSISKVSHIGFFDFIISNSSYCNPTLCGNFSFFIVFLVENLFTSF